VEGLGLILMQASPDTELRAALTLLENTGEWAFHLSLHGAHLRPIAFGSRECTEIESKLYSFTGEVACGRWAIAQNRRYLWGSHFYWLCDWFTVKQVLEYNENISLVFH